MSSKTYECHWKDCRREYTDLDQFKGHVMAHIDILDPVPVKDIPRYRKAGGYSIGPSDIQSSFEYLNSTQNSQPLRFASPPQFRAGLNSAANFTALGLVAQATPPITPMAPSPSLSTQVRAASSPRTLGRHPSPLSPTRGLASAFMESPIRSGSDVYHTPLIGRQTTPPPTEAEKKLLDDFIKTPTPPRPKNGEESESVNNNKRKRAAVAFEAPVTPANKKRKKNFKTPYPESGDEDEEDEIDEDEDEEGINSFIGHLSARNLTSQDQEPFTIHTQQPEGEWDDEEVNIQLPQQTEPRLEDHVDSILDDDGKYEIESQTDETTLTEDGLSFSPVVNS
ncbi:hypothetical protein CPB86DRAFT_874689 [Serendipita vermifera]|nr:hypothetical protein CPB86DRAFT_874689 [Serendipita vermifera]